VWQFSLLQILIALLPIGSLQVWLARSPRVRYVSAFMAISCGISMMLILLVSHQSPYGGPSHDLRLVPYLVGSLYGGIPGASILTVLYIAARLPHAGETASLVMLGLFFVLFVPALFAKIPSFLESTRSSKLKIASALAAILVVFQAGGVAAFGWLGETPPSVQSVGLAALFAVLLAALVLLSIHFVEFAYDRVRLLIDYQEIKAKYDNEVRRLQQFIDFSPLVVLFIEKDGRISHLNDLALKLLSPLTKNDVLQLPYRTVLQRWRSDTVMDAVEKVMGGEEQVADIIRFRNRIYYTTVCSWRAAPALRTEGAMLIAHDMTELQRLKDEVDKMERLSLVGQMAASITHEIRNPMAVIRGFVQLLNERSPKEHQSYFHIILQELDRANAIINDFLSLAQNRIVEKNITSLHEVLEDLMPLLSADANMRGQMIELKLADVVDPLELNVKEIKQLVLNLARNGMEAMDDKGVLRIETMNQADAVELRVTDNGVGIPPEKLERLFEPFYTTKANGTGLGLALCLSIMERHNGRIRVESKIGEGTTFIVSFSKPGHAISETAAAKYRNGAGSA